MSFGEGARKKEWHWRMEVKCRRSRGDYLRGAAGIIMSNPSTGTEALAQCSAVKRHAIMTIDASETAASPAV
jgi:hypothetical protein